YNTARGYMSSNIDYLLRAANYFLSTFHPVFSNFVFVVCSDDVLWSKANLRSSEIIDFRNFMRFLSDAAEVSDRDPNPTVIVAYSENKTAEEDMALLAMCNHTIMTVGTFGWWAGYLA